MTTGEAIDELSELFSYGHLKAASDPAGFIMDVVTHIKRLRKWVERENQTDEDLGFCTEADLELEFYKPEYYDARDVVDEHISIDEDQRLADRLRQFFIETKGEDHGEDDVH